MRVKAAIYITTKKYKATAVDQVHPMYTRDVPVFQDGDALTHTVKQIHVHRDKPKCYSWPPPPDLNIPEPS